jgi:hypothetical protein
VEVNYALAVELYTALASPMGRFSPSQSNTRKRASTRLEGSCSFLVPARQAPHDRQPRPASATTRFWRVWFACDPSPTTATLAAGGHATH